MEDFTISEKKKCNKTRNFGILMGDNGNSEIKQKKMFPFKNGSGERVPC